MVSMIAKQMSKDTIFVSLRFLVAAVFLFSIGLAPVKKCCAISPEEILVVANKKVAKGIDAATYYVKARNIPPENVLQITLTTEETMSREQYENVLKPRVIEKITALETKNLTPITTVVLMYGIPLKINADKVEQEAPPGEIINSTKASVDSELMLARKDGYKLKGWIVNPYTFATSNQEPKLYTDEVLLVSRLDGPDPTMVKRIIDDSIAVEKKGLRGRAYFDARWPMPEEKELSGYAFYDKSLHRAAQNLSNLVPTYIDDKEKLFPVNGCPQAALYSGWYSLAKYVDSFQWLKGAVAYHIASAECQTLRDKTSEIWCLKMLGKGVAATLGPVNEPYVEGFPPPDKFFTYLVQEHRSLGESYLYSIPFLSWQMVLIGDPLYRPFPPKEQ